MNQELKILSKLMSEHPEKLFEKMMKYGALKNAFVMENAPKPEVTSPQEGSICLII